MSESDFLNAVRENCVNALDNSGLTYEQVGERMGYGIRSRRQAVSQLLNKVADPRIGTLRKFGH